MQIEQQVSLISPDRNHLHDVGTNFVFALFVFAPPGDHKDHPYNTLIFPLYGRILQSVSELMKVSFNRHPDRSPPEALRRWSEWRDLG
jgi:hypothetical protein